MSVKKMVDQMGKEHRNRHTLIPLIIENTIETPLELCFCFAISVNIAIVRINVC